MKLWRVSQHADLSGRGGLLADARWSRSGTAVVYCADHPATALLEKLAHLDFEDIPEVYQLFSVSVPDEAPFYTVEAARLPNDWKINQEFTRSLGTELLRRGKHLFIWVPCALVPFAWNALLNPQHAVAKRCSIADLVEEPFDSRLVR
ncbi:MAG: RES family NAD+ phosphorylase [Propylenella sp.]